MPSVVTKESGRFTADDQVRALYLLQNYRRLVVGDTSGTISILTLAPELKLVQKISHAHSADIIAFAASEDVGLLFSVGADQAIRVHERQEF